MGDVVVGDIVGGNVGVLVVLITGAVVVGIGIGINMDGTGAVLIGADGL